MSNTRSLAKEFKSLENQLKHFLIFGNADTSAWDDFRWDFLHSSLTIDDRLTFLTDLFSKQHKINHERCFILLKDTVSASSSKKELFHIVSFWLEKFVSLKIVNKDNFTQLIDSLIKNLKELKSPKQFLEIILFSGVSISIPKLLIKYLSKKHVYDLLELCYEAVHKDKSLAPNVYKLFIYQSQRYELVTRFSPSLTKATTLGHLAMKDEKSASLYFSLIDLLETAGLSHPSINLLLKSKNASSTMVIDRAISTHVLSNLRNSDERPTLLAKKINKRCEQMLTAEDILSLLKEYRKGLYWLSPSLQVFALGKMKKKVKVSADISSIVTLLAVERGHVSFPCYSLYAYRNSIVAIFELIQMMMINKVNCLPLLKDFQHPKHLEKLIDSDVPNPIFVNTIKYLIANGLDFSRFMRKTHLLKHNGRDFNTITHLLALHETGIEVKTIKNILTKRLLHVKSVTNHDIDLHKYINKLVYTIFSKLTFESHVYNDVLRKCVMDHISTLTNDEKQTALAEIKYQLSPLANAFWFKPFLKSKYVLLEKWLDMFQESRHETLGWPSPLPSPATTR